MSTALTNVVTEDRRSAALLKAVGLDKVPSEQRELALAIADRYELDLMLKHLVMVEGKPYITRDGLLHVAHRSGVFDGIEVTDPVLEGDHWNARCTVWRKDMSRGFTYSGRYPAKGGNQRYAPEMATKVAECMALRRAFDVSAPVVDERWDLDTEATVTQARPVALADKVAARRADIEARTDAAGAIPAPAGEPSGDSSPGGTDEPEGIPAPGEDAAAVESSSPATGAQCGSTSDPGMPPVERCRLLAGHEGVHRTQGMSWPR